MIFIAAENIDQALNHARLNHFKKGDWRYVESLQTVRGVTGTLHIVGTFWDRRDAEEIYFCALRRGLCV